MVSKGDAFESLSQFSLFHLSRLPSILCAYSPRRSGPETNSSTSLWLLVARLNKFRRKSTFEMVLIQMNEPNMLLSTGSESAMVISWVHRHAGYELHIATAKWNWIEN